MACSNDQAPNLEQSVETLEQILNENSPNLPAEGVLEAIAEYRTEINTLIDGYQADLHAQTRDIQATIKNAIGNNEKECVSIKEEIIEMQDQLTKNANDNIKLFMQTKRGLKTISAIESRVSALEKKLPRVRYTFQRNQSLESMLKSKSNILGDVLLTDQNVDADNAVLTAEKMTQTEDENEETTEDSLSDSDLNLQCQEEGVDNTDLDPGTNTCSFNSADLIASGVISVKTESDVKTCSITGIACVNNGKLVYVDEANMCITLVDTASRRILHNIRLDRSPFDVTCLPKNRVAVTLPSKKVISIFSINNLNNTIRHVKTFPVNGECYGISYKSEKLAVSFLKPPRIDILDLNGNVCKSLSPTEQGRNILELPYYVTITDDLSSEHEGEHDVIYVSDKYRKAIIKLSLGGEVLFSYSDYIKYEGCTLEPKGLCAAGGGNVILCCYYRDENRITIVSHDGQKLKEYLTEDKSFSYQPCVACYNKRKERLYVAFSSEMSYEDSKCNEICVFEVRRV